MSEIEMIVSMSIATIRSIVVGPSTSRMTPSDMAPKMRAAATWTMDSAKDVLQMPFERSDDRVCRRVGVDAVDIEQVDEERVAPQFHHERARRQRDRIGKCQSADRRFEAGADLDDARLDIDPRRIDVAHHGDVGLDELDEERRAVE